MRSALGVDRMIAQLSAERRSGQARQPRAARRREASGLTRAQPWTNPKSYPCPVIQGQLHSVQIDRNLWHDADG